MHAHEAPIKTAFLRKLKVDTWNVLLQKKSEIRCVVFLASEWDAIGWIAPPPFRLPINLSETALFSPETEFVKKKGKSHPFRFLVFDLPPIAQQSVYTSIEADRYWAIKTVINRFFYITCTGPKRKIPLVPSRPHAAAAGLMLYGREAGQLRVKCGGWMVNFGIFWKKNFKGPHHSEHVLHNPSLQKD